MQDPVRMHKDVWVLHPEHHGTAVARGRAGTHYKVQRSKIPPGRPCEMGVQWVHVQDVFVPGVVPMYAGKQPHIHVMEDALGNSNDDASWVMWNTDFLLEIA